MDFLVEYLFAAEDLRPQQWPRDLPFHLHQVHPNQGQQCRLVRYSPARQVTSVRHPNRLIVTLLKSGKALSKPDTSSPRAGYFNTRISS